MVVALGVLFLVLGVGTGLFLDPVADFRIFAIFFVLSALLSVYWLGRRLRRGAMASLSIVVFLVVVGVVVQAAFLWHAPSDDVYRYLWEGRVQLAGENPYEVAPADPRLKSLRTAQDDGINHPECTAIYGPLAQAGFALVAAIAPTIVAWKISVLVGQLLGLFVFGMLLRRLGASLGWLVCFAWHPLVLWQIPGQGHLEGWITVFLLAGIWALTPNSRGHFRHITAGVFLAGAVLIKPTAAILLVLLASPSLGWRGRLQAIGSAVTVITICSLPYLLGWFFRNGAVLWNSLWRFGVSMRFNDFASLVFGTGEHGNALRMILSGAVFGAAVVVVMRWRVSPIIAAALIVGTSLLSFPTVHPWYGVLLVPLVVAASAVLQRDGQYRSGGLAVVACGWVLTLTLLFAGETEYVYHLQGAWREPRWVRWAVYMPVFATAAVVLVRERASPIARKTISHS